jgi:hypothetical protein
MVNQVEAFGLLNLMILVVTGLYRFNPDNYLSYLILTGYSRFGEMTDSQLQSKLQMKNKEI